jgi:hypothetical protein
MHEINVIQLIFNSLSSPNLETITPLITDRTPARENDNPKIVPLSLEDVFSEIIDVITGSNPAVNTPIRPIAIKKAILLAPWIISNRFEVKRERVIKAIASAFFFLFIIYRYREDDRVILVYNNKKISIVESF